MGKKKEKRILTSVIEAEPTFPRYAVRQLLRNIGLYNGLRDDIVRFLRYN
jgi:hypothetical protein